ncbi:MAG: DUF697 domain-containing protein [Desulfamplus sp.]|nr:DUF697 domain-containing protein [Desulfamplus sp.]
MGSAIFDNIMHQANPSRENIPGEDEIKDRVNLHGPSPATPSQANPNPASPSPANPNLATRDQANPSPANPNLATRDHGNNVSISRIKDQMEQRTKQAGYAVKTRAAAAAGAGVIPLPLFDMAVITAIQMDTVRALSGIYGVKFSRDAGKAAVTSLAGGIFPVGAGSFIGSAAKMIPFIGQIMGSVSISLIAGASTYALGRVFIQHFESGGTFLTFNPDLVRSHFKREYEAGLAGNGRP